MKRILAAFILLGLFISCHGQMSNRGEFATNSNGLMYSDADMKTLRFIVDSLNLRFKKCDLSKTYFSCPQANYYSITFNSKNKNDLQPIVAEIENNADFRQLIAKYSAYVLSIDSARLIIRGNNLDKEDVPYYYLAGDPGKGYSNTNWPKKYYSKDLSNSWIYEYGPDDVNTQGYSVRCRYFPQLKRLALPDQYSRLIQYVDCMIDTSASVFLTDNYSGFWYDDDEKNSFYDLKEIADYLDKKMGAGNNNNSKLKHLSEKQVSFASKKLEKDARFKDILARAIDAYVKNKTANHQLESIASSLGMADKTLLMKRCYRVMGFCSQDESPRLHARDIAILAAHSHSWDIFLRVHLDIMNDRFERAIDASYAWGDRKTYLKELEELNLNIVDLMIGLTLRADNLADNHYRGTVWRLGWALTESREKDVFEKKAQEMMKDESLDDFNRGLMYMLYTTYLYHLDNKEAKEKIKSLKEASSSYPGFIQTSINELKIPEEKKKE